MLDLHAERSSEGFDAVEPLLRALLELHDGEEMRDVDGDAAGAVTRTEPGEALGDFGSALSDAISASKEEEAAPAEPAPAEAEKAPEA